MGSRAHRRQRAPAHIRPPLGPVSAEQVRPSQLCDSDRRTCGSPPRLGRELGVPMRLAKLELTEHSTGAGAGRTATADHQCCSSSNGVASRSKLILDAFKSVRPRSAARWRIKARVTRTCVSSTSNDTFAAVPKPSALCPDPDSCSATRAAITSRACDERCDKTQKLLRPRHFRRVSGLLCALARNQMVGEVDRLWATLGQTCHDPGEMLEVAAAERRKQGVVNRPLHCRKTLKLRVPQRSRG